MILQSHPQVPEGADAAERAAVPDAGAEVAVLPAHHARH